MRIRVSDPVLIGDLLDYLLGNGCLAIQMRAANQPTSAWRSEPS
jgi:hypothetical protein